MRNPIRTISFFVCSTFRDMKAERTYLHEVILPRLNERFGDKGFRFELKDPRSSSRSEADADGPAGLSQSLAFIDRCRPCFIGIFGANYGSAIPRVPEALGLHYPEIQFYSRTSRIHLETLYGVLTNPAQAEQSYFYFRKPDFMEAMAPADRSLLESTTLSDTQRATEAFKLRMLKEAVVNSGRPVRDYDCAWDAGQRCVTRLEAFGEQVMTDMACQLEAFLPRAAALLSPAATPAAAVPIMAPPAVPVVARPAVPVPAPPAVPPPPADAFPEPDAQQLQELAEDVGLSAEPKHEAEKLFAEETLHGDEQPLKIEGQTPAEPPPATPEAPIPEVADETAEPNVVGEGSVPEVAGDTAEPDVVGEMAPVDVLGETDVSGGPTPRDPMPEDAGPPLEVVAGGSPLSEPVHFVAESPSAASGPVSGAGASGLFQFTGDAAAGPPSMRNSPFGFGEDAAGPASAFAFADEPGAGPIEDAGAEGLEVAGDEGERRKLLKAVAANPDAPEPLLAYAAWLSQRGDALGEFIQADLERDAMAADDPRRPALDARCAEILDQHAQEWLQPLAALGLQPLTFGQIAPLLWLKRGIVDSITIDKDGILPEQAAALFEAAPALRKISFSECAVPLAALAKLPQMKQIVMLGLSSLSLGPEDAQALAGSAHLGGLNELELNYNPLGRDGAKALARSPNLRNVNVLEMRGCELGPEGVSVLAESPFIYPVKRLCLGDNAIGPNGMKALAASPYGSHLEYLNVENNPDAPIGPEGASALAGSAHLSKLRFLIIGGNALGDEGVGLLASSTNLTRLEMLDLSGNDVAVAGVKALAESQILDPVTVLDLSGNANLGPEGAMALAGSAHLAHLKELKLARCGIQDEGLTALAASTGLTELMKLDVGGNGIGAAGAKALASAAALANLDELDLRDNTLGEEGIQALLDSPHLTGLKSLWLGGTGFGAAQEAALRERFGEAANLE